MNTKALAVAAALGLATLGISTQASAALTMNVTYYTVTTPDPDFQTQCCGTYGNLVKPTLGPNGLPVSNVGYGGPTINDVNANGEITWWTPGANVTQTGTGVVNLPFIDGSMFIPNGTGSNNSAGFQTAVFTGILVVPVAEQVTFTFGADDDAFLALNNTIIAQLGGVHGNTPGPVTTQILGPGSYNLTLFYADRNTTEASLNFSVDTQNVTVTGGVPEPTTWALMLMGFLGVGGAVRTSRRTRMRAAA